MKVQISQVSPIVGDLKGNLAMMKQEILLANQEDVDVVLFPELVTIGYPPRDLLYIQKFWDQHELLVQDLLNFIKKLNRQITVIFGGLHQVRKTYGIYAKYNAAYIIDKHYGVRIVHKKLLPCYNIFDESRYFSSGLGEPYIPIKIKINDDVINCDVLICEDMWNYKYSCEESFLPSSYTEDPVSKLVGDGPIFILNGSPFWSGKIKTTMKIVKSICKDLNRIVFWTNQVGSYDDIVTGGYSMALYPTDDLPHVKMGNMFALDRIVIDSGDINQFKQSSDIIMPKFFGKQLEPSDFDMWCDLEAMKLHLRDYCGRTGFKHVVLGLSGGIDSALVAIIAAFALGPENVHGISMPSKHSSVGSYSDSEKLASNLQLGSFEIISIKDLHESFRSCLLSAGKQKFNNSVTDENLQPRIRANILMAFSNDNNWLLLATGNLSELLMSYFTLYGDSSGGVAPIHDLFKTEVFAMCRFINKYGGEIIPNDIIDKPPSAELKDNQKDTDSLPEYGKLDRALSSILENNSIDQICEKSQLSPLKVQEIIKKYESSEFKRAQLCLGPKLRKISIGSGRRLPIARKISFLSDSGSR